MKTEHFFPNTSGNFVALKFRWELPGSEWSEWSIVATRKKTDFKSLTEKLDFITEDQYRALQDIFDNRYADSNAATLNKLRDFYNSLTSAEEQRVTAHFLTELTVSAKSFDLQYHNIVLFPFPDKQKDFVFWQSFIFMAMTKYRKSVSAKRQSNKVQYQTFSFNGLQELCYYLERDYEKLKSDYQQKAVALYSAEEMVTNLQDEIIEREADYDYEINQLRSEYEQEKERLLRRVDELKAELKEFWLQQELQEITSQEQFF